MKSTTLTILFLLLLTVSYSLAEDQNSTIFQRFKVDYCDDMERQKIVTTSTACNQARTFQDLYGVFDLKKNECVNANSAKAGAPANIHSNCVALAEQGKILWLTYFKGAKSNECQSSSTKKDVKIHLSM